MLFGITRKDHEGNFIFLIIGTFSVQSTSLETFSILIGIGVLKDGRIQVSNLLKLEFGWVYMQICILIYTFPLFLR